MKVLYSPVVICIGRSFHLNVVVDEHLCYLFYDLFDHCERLLGWPHESVITSCCKT